MTNNYLAIHHSNSEMPEVQYIKNVVAYAKFAATPSHFAKMITGMPDSNPDEVVIRAINFNGQVNDNFLYLVWCSLTNDFIASFCGGNLSPQSPGTVIRLNAPVPNMLEFKLYGMDAAGSEAKYMNAVTGDLAIHLDFIKYKRVPPHA